MRRPEAGGRKGMTTEHGRARGTWLALLAVVPCAFGSVAHAEPGDHIRVGPAEIIPSVKTGVEFHTNVYLRDGSSNASDLLIGAPFWMLRPGVEVKLDGPWMILSVAGVYGMRVYIDTQPDDAFEVSQLNRFNDVNLGVSAQFLPNRRVGFRVSDQFDIQNTPTDLHGDTVQAQNVNITHTGNDLEGGALLRPGSALDVGLLGVFSFDTYHLPEDYLALYPDVLNTPDNATFNDRFNFGPMVNATWRFLPKTSLIGMASVNWNQWNNNLIPYWSAGADGNLGEVIAKPDSMAWRLTTGVRGQLSPRVATGLEAGYGQMYFNEQSVLNYNSTLDQAKAASSFDLDLFGGEDAENYARDLTSFGEGLLLIASVSYTPIKGQNVSLIYKKAFQDVLFTNYSAYNSVNLHYDGRFFERLGVVTEYGFRLDRYHGEVARGDLGHRMKVEGTWDFTQALRANLSTGWTARYCADDGCVDTANPAVTYTSIQYDDIWVQAGASFTW